jgi:hypothetical protein
MGGEYAYPVKSTEPGIAAAVVVYAGHQVIGQSIPGGVLDNSTVFLLKNAISIGTQPETACRIFPEGSNTGTGESGYLYRFHMSAAAKPG